MAEKAEKKQAKELKTLLEKAEDRLPGIRDLEEAHAASRRVHERSQAADLHLSKRAHASDSLR